jgi:hypothetical protein
MQSGFDFGNPEMQDLAARYEVAARYKVCLLWDGELPELRPHHHWYHPQAYHRKLGRGREAMARQLDAE